MSDSPSVGAQTPSAPPIDQPEDNLVPFLAAEPLARTALAEIAAPTSIGSLVGTVPTDDGPVLLQFDCLLPGYPGWRWTAALGRPDADSTPTVLEVELLPGDDSLISPPWRPWEERYAEYQASHPKEEAPDQQSAVPADDSNPGLDSVAAETTEEEVGDDSPPGSDGSTL